MLDIKMFGILLRSSSSICLMGLFLWCAGCVPFDWGSEVVGCLEEW